MKIHDQPKTTLPAICRTFLFSSGLFLAVSEIWKQWYLTARIQHGHYNWWYFPFQLCSIPMYILLMLPYVKNPLLRRALLMFLMCFGMLGGIAVFADTSGLHYPAAMLTVHSYLWHFLLIFIGIAAGICYEYEAGSPLPVCRDFADSSVLYLFCCGIASIINAVGNHYGNINMFYINPHYKMEQVVFSEFVAYLGNIPTIFLYIAATIFGAWILSRIWKFLFRFLPLYRP